MTVGNKVTALNTIKMMNCSAPYVDIDVTLGDNRLNENVVNHYNALNQLI